MKPSNPKRFRLLVVGVGIAIQSTSLAVAKPKIVIPPELQQSALACLGEALRLCPDALSAKDHGLACIVSKRRSLSQSCQTVLEKGVQLLARHDVHLDELRQSKAK